MKVTNLTLKEDIILTNTLSRVLGCMSYNKEDGMYYDNENFLLSLDREDMETLRNIYEKLK